MEEASQQPAILGALRPFLFSSFALKIPHWETFFSSFAKALQRNFVNGPTPKYIGSTTRERMLIRSYLILTWRRTRLDFNHHLLT